MNERRERRYQQEKVQRGRPDTIGDQILPDCGRRLSFGIQYALEDDIAESHRLFHFSLGAGRCRVKRKMHGLLNRIFAAFDGAKIVESPTLARR